MSGERIKREKEPYMGGGCVGVEPLYKEKNLVKKRGRKLYNAFAVKQMKEQKVYSNNKKGEIHHTIIIMRNEKGYEKIHSSFTGFLYSYWENKEENSIYNRACNLVKFLNWVLENSDDYKDFKSFSDLTFEIATDYLSMYGLSSKYETVVNSELTLSYFYYYLAENDILKHIKVEDFPRKKEKEPDYQSIRNSILPNIGSPFSSVRYPLKKSKTVTHHLSKPLIPLFINMSKISTPEITLGIILGIFGGLRRGEIVNLNRSSLIPLGANANNGFEAIVEFRDLRPDILDIKIKGGVKKPRRQVIYENLATKALGKGEMQKIYSAHIEKYKPTDGSGALFINNNGNAMTAHEFSRRFSFLKKSFIQYLMDSGNPTLIAQSEVLSNRKWSAHLLRGIFSNLYAEETENIFELMNARGDSYPFSSLTYLTDTDKIANELKDNTREAYQHYFEVKPSSQDKFKYTGKKD
jgi:hypothetical protein